MSPPRGRLERGQRRNIRPPSANGRQGELDEIGDAAPGRWRHGRRRGRAEAPAKAAQPSAGLIRRHRPASNRRRIEKFHARARARDADAHIDARATSASPSTYRRAPASISRRIRGQRRQRAARFAHRGLGRKWPVVEAPAHGLRTRTASRPRRRARGIRGDAGRSSIRPTRGVMPCFF